MEEVDDYGLLDYIYLHLTMDYRTTIRTYKKGKILKEYLLTEGDHPEDIIDLNCDRLEVLKGEKINHVFSLIP